MPQFLANEIQDYLKMLYGIGPHDQIFTVTKSYLHREMDRGAREAGVPRISIHGWQGKRNGHAGQHEQEVGIQAGFG